MADLPTGTLTFLFTDIEGSTRLWEAQPAEMQMALARHDALLRHAITSHRGHVFKTVGDAFCAAFPTAPEAVDAALEAQRSLRVEPWPAPLRLKVRMALHSGAAELRDADYFGEALNRVARLLAAGHGDQTLISEATGDLCRDHLPPLATLKSLGEHHLKDLTRRERVFQLLHAELPRDFPPLKTLLRPPDTDTPSIAVLPFVNLTRDEENEYFAAGLADELLNMLSKIRDVRVASRTSAFYFKGKDVDLATVAQKLNVATVLEGSVRKSGNRVRITVQLIEVATDSHLWSETYDRELTEIFAVQDDIAKSVVTELRVALLGEARSPTVAAQVAAEVETLGRSRGGDVEAYRLYLQGRFFVDRKLGKENARGMEMLRQALALQPDFALAWTGLARGYRHEAEYFSQSVAPSYAQARAAAQRALELAPEGVEGHIELGRIRTSDWDWQGAEAALARALQLASENAEALLAAGVLARIRGQPAEGIAFGRRAVALDPLSVDGHVELARTLIAAGQLDAAEDSVRAATDLNPATGSLFARLGTIRMMQGRPEEAIAAYRKEHLEYARLWGVAVASHALDRAADSDAALNALIERYSDSCAYQIGEIHAFRGDTESAFAWLERAYAQRDHGLHAVLHSVFLNNLRGDPRWRVLLSKLGLSQ
jgi:TolB-like protein/class 3 adenylate cyclase/Tfp pilus assembly protein PilF